MSVDLKTHGLDWLKEQLAGLTEEVIDVSPTQLTEDKRYLPPTVSPNNPGPMSFDLNPFAREIVDCFDINSPVREVTLMKGVQITYTTMLESGILYYIVHVKTAPCMYVTADAELAQSRVENYFLQMLEHSGLKHLIRSNDTGNSRKTGNTKKQLQWEGGGWLKPIGSLNAAKMRQDTILILIKDELDGWPTTVGKDGCPDKLTSDRCKGVWNRRKIFRGSTPAEMATSKIYPQFKRGDQRKYYVPCIYCGMHQYLSWGVPDPESKKKPWGFIWDMNSNGSLAIDSVRYRCKNPDCRKDWFEYDKTKLFALESGAEWRPTATPVEPNIRSYHLPAFYSPCGLTPWSALVTDFLEAYDPITMKVLDYEKYKTWTNNVKGRPFQVQGFKLTTETVNSLRRDWYAMKTVPNRASRIHCNGPICFLTCQVDVHKEHLDVAVMGWSRGSICHLVDYFQIEDDNCTDINSPAWDDLSTHIEDAEYFSDDDGEEDLAYRIAMTFIDARAFNKTVVEFCGKYEAHVHPILGTARPDNYSNIKNFYPFTSNLGTLGYKIIVDFYKDSLSTILRREWTRDAGMQRSGHFNVPADTPDKALKELTTEYKRREKDSKGRVVYRWYRPDGVRNELWDLLVYGNCAMEVVAQTWMEHMEYEELDWNEFWNYYEANISGSISG